MGRLPNFLIIGAAKSGTTSLFQWLSHHPQICVSSLKEPNFFGDDANYAKGLTYYSSLFRHAQSHQVCGEASTDYAKWPKFPNAAARISQTLSDVKLIYIMRNPVERAYSYYVHINRNRPIRESFEAYICRTTEALDASNYMLQIEQYLNYFSRESFLFLLLDDLVHQPQQVLQQVCRFIGVSESADLPQQLIIANQGSRYFEDTIRGKITAPFRSLPLVAAATTLLPQSWRDQAYHFLQQSAYGQVVRNQYLPRPIRAETRQMLMERFADSNRRLAEFLGRDLSFWETAVRSSQDVMVG